MGRALALLVTIAALILAAACADGSQQVAASGAGPDAAPGAGGPSPEPPSTPGTPGGAPGGLVVSIEVGGGFVPVGHDFRSVPTAVVYEDGTTLSAGPVVLRFPGPAVHPVLEGRLAGGEVAALVEAAAEAGILGPAPLDTGEPPLADAATTTVTVVVDGAAHVTSVYALAEVDQATPGLTPDQLDARRRVAAVVDEVTAAVGAGEADAHQPERYRVLPLPAGAVPDEPVDGIAPGERPWPFPDLALAEGRCTAVTGEAAAAFAAELAEVDELTRWRTPAGAHALAVRPVLPHEPDCPA